jgi:hypothetical protein
MNFSGSATNRIFSWIEVLRIGYIPVVENTARSSIGCLLDDFVFPVQKADVICHPLVEAFGTQL